MLNRVCKIAFIQLLCHGFYASSLNVGDFNEFQRFPSRPSSCDLTFALNGEKCHFPVKVADDKYLSKCVYDPDRFHSVCPSNITEDGTIVADGPHFHCGYDCGQICPYKTHWFCPAGSGCIPVEEECPGHCRTDGQVRCNGTCQNESLLCDGSCSHFDQNFQSLAYCPQV